MSSLAASEYAFRPHKQVPAAGLADAIRVAVKDLEFELAETATDLDLRLAAVDLAQAVQVLSESPELSFDYLRNVTGLDMGADGLAAKYHLYSFRHGWALQVTVVTPPGEPHVPSLTSFFAAADWHEREAAEMVGLVFDGHPNPKNLLLEEDLRIHPLLKSHPLQKVEILQGIEEGPPGFPF